ncbi:unnamed protein product, partial [marine sediment metagenome]
MNFDELRHSAKEEWKQLELSHRPLVLVGNATCGRSAGSSEILDVFREEIESLGLACNIIEVGCIGLCYAEPIVCIKKHSQPAICYANITSDKATKLIDGYLRNNDPLAQYALGIIGEGI